MLTPRYEVEGDTLVLIDDEGNEIADYPLSPLQNPAEVAEWLHWFRSRSAETVGA
jgi:hypothetical protein